MKNDEQQALWDFPEIQQPSISPLYDQWVIPPFTVLNSMLGEWRQRKAAWLKGMKIDSVKGRDVATYRGALSDNDAIGLAMQERGGATSIFDPVLCELVYRWFSDEEAQVVDPFAGGSVRGVVAKTVRRKYWGCDLNPDQIRENILQARVMFDEYETLPGIEPDLEWICGDSAKELEFAPEADLVFSCPPYGDLEKYTDHPADISNMGWDDFVSAYRKIIAKACDRLKENRFACFVVGDFRDKKGFYRGFVSETVQAFELAGLRFYNDAVLCTPVGTAALRASKQFKASRKMVKTHQNVLVFVKGDPKKAAKKCEGFNDG